MKTEIFYNQKPKTCKMKLVLYKILLAPLIEFNSHNTIIKLIVSLNVAVISSPIFMLLHSILKRLIPDFDFIVTVVILLSVDLALGVWRHIDEKTFDHEDMILGLMRKTAICFFSMILFNGMLGIKEFSDHPDILSWLTLVGKLTIVVYIFTSAAFSLSYLSGGRIPPIGIMKRMKKFEDTGDVTSFTNNGGQQEQPTETPTETTQS